VRRGRREFDDGTRESAASFVLAEHPLHAIRPLIADAAIRRVCRGPYSPIARLDRAGAALPSRRRRVPAGHDLRALELALEPKDDKRRLRAQTRTALAVSACDGAHLRGALAMTRRPWRERRQGGQRATSG